MDVSPPMVGRVAECGAIRSALDGCRAGRGPPVLVGGEAGIGKTRLIAEVLREWDGTTLRAVSQPGDGPYAPVSRVVRLCSEWFGEGVVDPAVTALVTGTRAGDGGAVDQLADGLAATLREVSRDAPVVIVLEDLHWASATTLALVPRVVGGLAGAPVLPVMSYRSDELVRAHPMRAARAELRRTGPLVEVMLAPLEATETGELVGRVVRGDPSPRLVTAIHDRAGGLPLFTQELAAALAEAGALADTPAGMDLGRGAAIPIPESITDAVLLRVRELMTHAATAVEVAAVLGPRVELDLLADLARADEVDALLDSSLLVEDGAITQFRHALVRDALYRTIPWARRRAHHRRIAEVMTARGGAPALIAGHWLSAHEYERARPSFVVAAEQFRAVGAYRDAATAIRNALRIWPAAESDAARADLLERLADCTEMDGAFDEAAETWAEVAELWRERGDADREARTSRRLATAADMRGDWERATAARAAAAAAFIAAGRPVEAVADHLAVAEQFEAAAQPTRALTHVEAAITCARDVDRDDLLAHGLSLKGVIVAALGRVDEGLAISRSGVRLALDRDHHGSTGASYYDLATTLIYASEYAASADTWSEGVDFCRAHDLVDRGTGCLACMAVAVRFLGDWDRAVAIGGAVLGDAEAPQVARMIAHEETSLIQALRGGRRGVTSLLRDVERFGRSAGIFGVEIGSMWGLAVIADSGEHTGEGHRRSLALVDRCEQAEASHFALPALRWAATWLADVGRDGAALERAHRVLARYAADNSAPKVLSVLAHVGAEESLLHGEPSRAVDQFRRSLQLLGRGAFPFDTALTQVRLGAALAATGERERAVDTIAGAYRTARLLGSRPLARRCAETLDGLGEQVDRRLGRLAARALEPAGLTRRERDVLRLLASGTTNRAIAAELYLSVRTIDMHVRNILAKLDCSSRSAATRRAIQLGLVDERVTDPPEIPA